MNENINLLRLACLLQDRDNQDFKRVILSLIFEILYENSNIDINADDLYKITLDKCKEPIERDFFNGLLDNSKSFELTNTGKAPLVKLTTKKLGEVEKSIVEFSIENPIEDFLKLRDYPTDLKDTIIKILYQSIYENIYAFNPTKIDSLVPNVIKEKFTQKELNIFNEFLEYDNPKKNRILYNQFVKAIEFAILTSGKGVKKFSNDIYTNKVYLLDTNVIFRMLGVGGEEEEQTILKLIRFCINQGVKFEYSLRTHVEFVNTLESSVKKIQVAERTKKIDILQELVSENPHFFNDDFTTQYSRLKSARKVNSAEQYELNLNARFKQLCKELNLNQSEHKPRVEEYQIKLLANHLIKERKRLIYSYSYAMKQAKVDAYNVLFVRKIRGGNNYNYSDVKSFYLTTDRGLNKILSESDKIIIPATILPSQLFAIHNPLTDDSKDLDYESFFSFIKRRTSEFKYRGKDIFSFIEQAQLHTTDKDEIKNLIVTFSDVRYKSSKVHTVKEKLLLKFEDFSKTYFDNRLNEFESVEKKYSLIKGTGEKDKIRILNKTRLTTKHLDLLLIVFIIPILSIGVGLITKMIYFVIVLILLEGVKYWLSKKENFNTQVWKYLFSKKMKKTPFYRITTDDIFILEGLAEIDNMKTN